MEAKDNIMVTWAYSRGPATRAMASQSSARPLSAAAFVGEDPSSLPGRLRERGAVQLVPTHMVVIDGHRADE